MLRRPISRAVVLGGACLLALAPFFWRGIPSGHDFEFHLFSWMEVIGQWQQGILYPRWAAMAHWGYGEARFLFYPPASWALGAALGAILPWKLAPGAYCWIALSLAGASMYRLAREWLPASEALFAGVFYALNPYHLLIVYWRSAYAELLAAALLPLVLLYVVKLDGPGAARMLRLGVTLAAAWLANAPAAVMIHYSAAGLVVLLALREAAKQDAAWRTKSGRIVWRATFAILLGAGLASFYLVPATYEQKWINVGEVLSPGVRPQDNFLFTTIADVEHNRFNLLVSAIGLSEILVLILAVVLSARKIRGGAKRSLDSPGDRAWLPLSVWGAGSALLMMSVSSFAWQHLPKLRFMQLPFRWLLCMNAALAMLFTLAIKRWRWRAFTYAFLLAVLIVAGYRIQPPWWDTAADIREMSRAVADGSGYEGTDEYVPAGADAYELNKALPLLSDASGAPVPGTILKWAQTEKHFTVHTAAPQLLSLRLFNYPAWNVTINGKHTDATSAEVTGIMVIPIAAGDNDVRVDFCRTPDREAGGIVSLISLGLLALFSLRSRRRNFSRL